MAKRYRHGRVEYSHKPQGLSYQHRDDGNGTTPLPEHGSHVPPLHKAAKETLASLRRTFESDRKANDAKVGGRGWSSK